MERIVEVKERISYYPVSITTIFTSKKYEWSSELLFMPIIMTNYVQ
jgi:hypothetical protein